MTFDLRECSLDVVRDLCERFHGYASAGGSATYAFAVYEGEAAIAGYAWQPPAYGAALSTCPEAPAAVLMLSRMAATPREHRKLKHVSKPLRVQMKRRIDRSRWPVLIAYSDLGQGHNGYVYECSGWTPTRLDTAPVYVDASGARRSRYCNGIVGGRALMRDGTTEIQRWEHWACGPGQVAQHMAAAGWRRVPSGRVWKSGNAGFTWKREAVS